MALTFTDNEKFSLIAIYDCWSTVEDEVELADGTWVLPKMPTDVGETWARWVGELRMERLTDANLIPVRRIVLAVEDLRGVAHMELYQQVFDIWNMLQLSGIVYYADASALQGSFENGQANVRQMVHLDQFYLTAKSPQYPVTLARLKEAAEMAVVWRQMAGGGKCDRFVRGGVILRQGMTEQYGQERIHQFARAIEALIKPSKSGTTKQFKNRPQTFGVNSAKMEKVHFYVDPTGGDKKLRQKLIDDATSVFESESSCTCPQ